jgi:predicted ATPase
MLLKTVQVTNFKSFKKLDVNLEKFNVLIGANASGKSNFLQIFRFLKDIAESGLDNAISLQGGIEYLRNMGMKTSNTMTIKIISETNHTLLVGKSLSFKGEHCEYEFTLRFRGKEAVVIHDRLMVDGNFLEFKNKTAKKTKELGAGKLTFSKNKNNYSMNLSSPKGVIVNKGDFYPNSLLTENMGPKTLLLDRQLFFVPFLMGFDREIEIYNFDPKMPKKAVPITGKIEMKEDGSNLALVLKHIISNKEKKRKFSNLIKGILPFIDDIDIERFADKSLLFNIKEKYFKGQSLPASLISDGTVNLTAMILALYFQEATSIFIEEPERNIHPHLISKVVEMMKDASKNRQIIATTHNSEMVKHAGLDNILLVSRDKNGFSTIYKPADKKAVKTFLENELGIEELFVQDLLGV